MRKRLFVTLVGLGLALLAGSGSAQTNDGLSFGIRPTKAFEDRPETFSYFSHELELGAVLADEALVTNTGTVPVNLEPYAADGVTAINTGTSFANRGEEATGFTRGVSRWLSFSQAEIALEPGEEILVPFTITVPLDAAPGHHVAGLVVMSTDSKEAMPGGQGAGQFAAIVVQQAAVAVVIDVPGPHVAGLEITGTCMKEQGDIGATFEVDVHNRGNVIVRGAGSLSIMDRNFEELASVPLRMGAVLPGDVTTFQVTHPLRLADGDYLLSEVLTYEEKAAVLQGTEITVKDGQPDVGCDPEEEPASPPFSITDIVPALGDGGPPFVRYSLYGVPFVALALAVVAFILLRKARRRRASPEPRREPGPGTAGGGPTEAPPGDPPSQEKAGGASESGPSVEFRPRPPRETPPADLPSQGKAESVDESPPSPHVTPPERSEEEPASTPFSITDIGPALGVGGPPLVRYAAYGAPLLLAFVVLRKAGRRRNHGESPEPA